jgi:hypothetical protein
MLAYNNHLRVVTLRGAELCTEEASGDHSDDAMQEFGTGLGFNSTLETLVGRCRLTPGCHCVDRTLCHGLKLGYDSRS